MQRHTANTVHAHPAERTWSASLSGQDACLRLLAGVRSRFGDVSASEHGVSVLRPPWSHSVHSHRGLCSHQQGVRCGMAVWETRRRRQRPCVPVGSQHPLRIHRCPPWQTIGSRGSSSSDATSELLLPATSVPLAAWRWLQRELCCARLPTTRVHRAPLQSTNRMQALARCQRRHAQRRHLQRTLFSVPRASQMQHCVRKEFLFLTFLRLQVLECLHWPASPAQQGAAEQL